MSIDSRNLPVSILLTRPDSRIPFCKTYRNIQSHFLGSTSEGQNQIQDKQNRDNALIILEEHSSVILITEGKKQIIRIKPNIFTKLKRCDSCVI